eukprot:TRINITY_DN30911_c0_g1_i1.p1 TRINITY_DN30911_c0_g1~~TRINITY_DN30911_c0_g1_i1.p1  ORF type:complete len:295 (-),score=47.87 TRINITY_DN30911_c0_g1_i1:249-1061(-)
MEPCRFFEKGKCAFGSACRFAHVPKAPPRRAGVGVGSGRGGGTANSSGTGAPGVQLCRFFLNGGCAFGDSCRFAHGVQDSTLPAALDSFPNAHGFEDSTLPVEAVPSSQSSFKPEPRRNRTLDLEDGECGICFESIRKKGGRFGMLENCDHSFCLSCIRSWRKQREQQDRTNLRLCPICRNESFFVIPGDSLLLDPEEKRKVIDKYKTEMTKIPCKLFDYGKGKCPFGTSCFYAHLNPDGTRFVPAPLRWMAGADGNSVVNEVKLSDFFD